VSVREEHLYGERLEDEDNRLLAIAGWHGKARETVSKSKVEMPLARLFSNGFNET